MARAVRRHRTTGCPGCGSGTGPVVPVVRESGASVSGPDHRQGGSVLVADGELRRRPQRERFVRDRPGAARLEDGAVRGGLADESVYAAAVDAVVCGGPVRVGVWGLGVLVGALVVVTA